MATYALSFNTNTLYIDPTNSRLGINTTSPLASLDIYGNWFNRHFGGANFSLLTTQSRPSSLSSY